MTEAKGHYVTATLIAEAEADQALSDWFQDSMIALYGRRPWETSGFAAAKDIWMMSLKKRDLFTSDVLKSAIAHCVDNVPTIPTLPQFIEICRAKKPRQFPKAYLDEEPSKPFARLDNPEYLGFLRELQKLDHKEPKSEFDKMLIRIMKKKVLHLENESVDLDALIKAAEEYANQKESQPSLKIVT